MADRSALNRLDDHANKIAASVYAVIAEGRVRTADMGGNAATSDFTSAVIKGL